LRTFHVDFNYLLHIHLKSSLHLLSISSLQCATIIFNNSLVNFSVSFDLYCIPIPTAFMWVSHAAKANTKWVIDEWCFIESVWLCDILASVLFPVKFLFDLVFSPSDTSHPSVCLCQNLLNMKQVELAQKRSTAENLPPFYVLASLHSISWPLNDY